MEIIAGLLAILGLTMLLVALIGFAFPAIFKNKKTGEIPKRSQMLIGGFFASIISFAISAALMPEKNSGVESNKNGETESKSFVQATSAMDNNKNKVESTQQKSLGLTPEEFRQSFNSIIGQIDTDWKMAELDIEKGEVNDTFKRILSKQIAIIGTVNKTDGLLLEIMVIASGSSDPLDNIKTVSVLLAVSQSVNKNIPKEKNSKVVSDMVQTAIKNIKTGEAIEKTVGNLKYTASASELFGLMFSISPI